MGYRPSGLGSTDLFYSTRKDGKWTEPVNLKAINSAGTEYSPTITGDKKNFYFASTRSAIKTGKPINYSELSNRINAPGNGLGDIYFISIEELMALLAPYK